MKGLLHSKRFKQNLYKWLFMYVGALLLLATVITYSKYIANLLGTSDDARSARFNVLIDPVDCNAINKTCNTGAYLFDDEITYAFIVDPSELEADANLVVTITADDDFEITKIVQDDKIICQNSEETTACRSNINSSFINEEVDEEISSNISTSNHSTITYQITVKYKYSEEELIQNNYVYDYNKIVNIGYSAIQSN